MNSPSSLGETLEEDTMTTNNEETRAPTEFTLFSKLSPELRLKIWEEALPRRRIVRVTAAPCWSENYVETDDEAEEEFEDEIEEDNDGDNEMAHEEGDEEDTQTEFEDDIEEDTNTQTPNSFKLAFITNEITPGIFTACRESRTVAIKHFPIHLPSTDQNVEIRLRQTDVLAISNLVAEPGDENWTSAWEDIERCTTIPAVLDQITNLWVGSVNIKKKLPRKITDDEEVVHLNDQVEATSQIPSVDGGVGGLKFAEVDEIVSELCTKPRNLRSIFKNLSSLVIVCESWAKETSNKDLNTFIKCSALWNLSLPRNIELYYNKLSSWLPSALLMQHELSAWILDQSQGEEHQYLGNKEPEVKVLIPKGYRRSVERLSRLEE